MRELKRGFRRRGGPAVPAVTGPVVVTQIVLYLLLGGGPLAAQIGEPAPARVMVLGTYHFANPGLDVAQYEVADVLTPAKQREIESVVNALARFCPTKVAIEALPSDAPHFDSLYHAFRRGTHSLDRDEREQLGFQLAHRFDHPRVHPIDYRGTFPFGPVMSYAETHEPSFIDWFEGMIAATEAEEGVLQRTATVGEILLHYNDPERIAAKHGDYVRTARVGVAAGYPGAAFLSAWYDRNIHIFANLSALIAPEDRVIVIFGEGHAGILRELIRAEPRMQLVEAGDYLREMAASDDQGLTRCLS